MRGVLRQARGGKAPPAAAAQILSHVHVSLTYRPQAELATYRGIESITSSFPLSSDLERSTSASVVAELLFTFCPEGEPAQRSYRLGVAALEAFLAGARSELVVAYVQYWVLALGGVFPAAEEDTATLNSADISFLSACRRLPLSDFDIPLPASTAAWLDTRVREEAERPLRALGFLRRIVQ